MIKVESGVPLPTMYPFAQMKVNDSFAVPKHINRAAVSVAALRYGERHNMKFTVRLTPDRTLRCWRIK